MKDQKPFQEIPNDEETGSETLKGIDHKKSSSKLDRKCLCISTLIIIIIFYISLFYWFFHNEAGNLDSDTPTAARMLGHGGSHKRTCDDTEYGCCKIFTDCKVVDDHVNYEHININVHRIKSHDNFMSNCPSLETLINKYNRHYGNISTDCGEYGCCPGINIDCDNAIRKSIRNGNNQNTIDTFLNHKKYKPILINKIDSKGSNCYQNNLYDIIYSYEHYYPEKNNGTDLIIYIIGIILFILWLTN
jgi:hypothetical protein